MQIYEYLFAGLIIVALLTGSTVMMISMSTPISNASDKDLLKVTGEKIMTQLLLDPGYPSSWGSDNVPQEITVFGLAKYGQTSRDAYDLDPNKVLQIGKIDGLTNYPISKNIVLDLLNLENTYGFTIEFKEALRITSPQQTGPNSYSITVTSDYNLPLMGTQVSAVLYYIDNSQSPPKIAHEGTIHGSTLYDGSCSLEFTSSPTTDKILFVAANYYGIHQAKLFQINSGTPLHATLFQDRLVPDPATPYQIQNGADSREVLLIRTESGFEANDFQITNAGTASNFVLENPPENSAIAVIAISGNNLLLADRDFSQIVYRTIDFPDPNTRATDSAYSLDRTVQIDGSTFTATLYIWRMSY